MKYFKIVHSDCRHEEIEEMKILKTRAMREKSNISHDSIKFAVIKIKFPDGFDLQVR